jgi:hypothetical protein
MCWGADTVEVEHASTCAAMHAPPPSSYSPQTSPIPIPFDNDSNNNIYEEKRRL